jgi:uncharacterized sulfatase
MRAAQQDLATRIRDIGFLPENEIHKHAGSGAPYDAGRQLTSLPRIHAMAQAKPTPPNSPPASPTPIAPSATGPPSAISSTNRRARCFRCSKTPPRPSASSPPRRSAAHGAPADLAAALAVLVDLADMEKHGVFVALQALNALDYLGAKAAPVEAPLQALAPGQKKGAPQKLREHGAPAARDRA